MSVGITRDTLVEDLRLTGLTTVGWGWLAEEKKNQNKTWVSKDELTHYWCYKKSVLQYLMLFLDTDMAHLERCRPG